MLILSGSMNVHSFHLVTPLFLLSNSFVIFIPAPVSYIKLICILYNLLIHSPGSPPQQLILWHLSPLLKYSLSPGGLPLVLFSLSPSLFTGLCQQLQLAPPDWKTVKFTSLILISLLQWSATQTSTPQCSNGSKGTSLSIRRLR